jgi:PIN domain nuclease of toxin-antitoxin system
MSDKPRILDASALLAAMLDEPGAAAIRAILPTARIGAVNLSEVIAKLQERGVPDDVIDQSLADLDIDVVPFDRDQADRTGKLRTATRAAGLSLGDRACLALAITEDAIAVTMDRNWAKLDLPVVIELARG